MKTKWYYVLGACFVVAIIGTAVYAVVSDSGVAEYRESRSIAHGATTFEDLADRFEQLAESKGALYAFEVLKRADIPPNTDMHLLAHRVGDILYKQKGIDGIQYCTQEFRNACSHTMVVGALTEFGESALPIIREACRKAPGGVGAYTMCYHGLGHGIFAFYGYVLPETVALCEKTGTKEYNFREAIECIGGAIMELEGGGGHDPDSWLMAQKRYLGPASHPLSVCLSPIIPESSQAQCITYLVPELFKAAGIDLGNPDPELFAKSFELCTTIPSSKPDLRTVCYGSFGKEFVAIAASRDIRRVDAMSDEKYSTVIGWCMRAGPTSGKAACVNDALSSLFWGGENNPDASFRFCALVDDASIRSSCYGNLARSIRQYVRDDSIHEGLCAKLPKESRAACTGR